MSDSIKVIFEVLDRDLAPRVVNTIFIADTDNPAGLNTVTNPALVKDVLWRNVEYAMQVAEREQEAANY